MKAYLLDEDADLQETNQDLELIGAQNYTAIMELVAQ